MGGHVKAEQREKEYIRQLKFLSESATEFVKLTPDEDIYAFIARKIKGICEDSIVIVTILDEQTDELCVRALAGLGKYTRAVTKIMGANPVGQCFPLDDAAREGLGQSKLLKVPGGIYDLTPGIPRIVYKAIEKLLGLGDVYSMGLNSEGHLYGSVTLLTRSTTGLKNHELIEAFINQAGIAIRCRQADLALRDSDKRFEMTIKCSNVPIYVVDPKGVPVVVNKAFETMMGYSSEDLLELDFTRYTHPDDLEEEILLYNELVGGLRDSYAIEKRNIRKDGKYIWLRQNVTAVRNERNETAYLIAVGEDITERRSAEEAYRSLVDHSLQGLAIFQEGRVVFANQAMAEITGYSVGEMLARSPDEIRQFVHPEDRELVWERHKQRLEGKHPPQRYELRGVRKDGSVRRLEINASSIEYQGKPAIQAAYIDITERKEAEEALKDSEQRFKMLFECAPDGIYLCGMNGNIVDVNKAVESLSGYEREELIGLDFTKAGFLTPEEIDKALDSLKRSLDGEIVGPDEFTLTRKDGSQAAIETRAFSVRIGDENLVLGIARDITERKKAENDLKNSEEQFRITFDKAGIGMALVDLEGRIIDSNADLQNMLGYSRQELVNMSFIEFTHPEDVRKDWGLFKKLLAGKREHYRIEKCYVRKDGQFLWGCLTGSMVRNAEGEPRFVVGMLEDITDRKKAEAALILRNRAINSSTEGISITDPRQPDNPVIYVNKGFEAITGYKSSEVIGKNMRFLQGKHTDQRSISQLAKAIEECREHTVEILNYRKDGSAFWNRIALTPVRDDVGALTNFIAIHSDMSDEKAVEERLHRYQARLKDMASKILTAEDDERRRIAAGMHDSICQKLVVSKMALDSSLQLIGDANVTNSLKIVSESIGEAIEQADSLTFDLSSPALHELGLVTAIGEYLEREIHKKHGIAVELEGDEQLAGLDGQVKNVLFRTTRELLMNVVKHARADKVEVCVRKCDDHLCLSVEDNGAGFYKSDVAEETRFGLFSINEQLGRFGGRLKLDSRPGRGTKATVRMPLERLKGI